METQKITLPVFSGVGNTPLFQLKEYPDIYVKMEGYNRYGSVKSRVAANMILSAEERGILTPFSGQTILEASGGSTGWALNGLSRRRGYKFTCVLPDNYSPMRIQQMRAFGANVQTSDHTLGNDSHFKLARKLERENPDFYYIDQLSNMSNPDAHYKGTGPEILAEAGSFDYLICGVGSGGTLSGVGHALKERNPNLKIIAVQPKGCDILKGKAIPHSIQGFAVGLVPTTFDISIVDEVMDVSYEEAINTCKDVFDSDGLSLGLSSGANITAATRFFKGLKSGRVVTVAPDLMSPYLAEHFINNK